MERRPSGKRTPQGPLLEGAVTALAARRGRPDRVAVFLDGSLAFELAAVLVERTPIHKGDRLTVECQERLMAEDAPYRARDRALRLLTTRERSRGEVGRRLRTAGFSPEVVDDTVEWLQGLGYLDDGRFVARYVDEKLGYGWGERRIRAELLKKGVERRLIDAGLAEGVGDRSEQVSDSAADGMEAITALARRRFGRSFAADPEGSARRLAGFMARRGYDWESVSSVIRILTEEAGTGGEMSVDE